jgi:AcrR family transcriptional regulator
MVTDMNMPRQYEMKRRATSAAATHERIMDAYTRCFWSNPGARISLAEVAAEAGTTVQTVLRHFGSKEALVQEVLERELVSMRKPVDPAAAGDVHRIAIMLVDHQERHGRRTLRVLSAAFTSPALQALVEEGNVYHRQWCEVMFARWLEPLVTRRRRVLLAELLTVCDARTWGMLRDQGDLSSDETKRALVQLLKSILERNPATAKRSRQHRVILRP